MLRMDEHDMNLHVLYAVIGGGKDEELYRIMKIEKSIMNSGLHGMNTLLKYFLSICPLYLATIESSVALIIPNLWSRKRPVCHGLVPAIRYVSFHLLGASIPSCP